MDSSKRDFDKVAANWDEEPGRVKLAVDVGRAISEEIDLTPATDVLDFGCGTGLLTLNLQPRARSITGVDSSQGMLDALKAKIEALKLPNVIVRHVDLDRGDALGDSYDLITSSMTLHHVKDIETLLDTFYKSLAPAGRLCIADLDLDGGMFHEDSTGVFHDGFDRKYLLRAFEAAGFTCIRDRTAARIVKPAAGGGTKEFTVFLMTGRKR